MGCGKEFPTSKPSALLSADPPHALKKMSVLLLIFLGVITGGIYYGFWFLRARKAVNDLETPEKLENFSPIFSIVMYATAVLSYILTGFFEETRDFEAAEGFEIIGDSTAIIGYIFIIISAFKVRRILDDHFNRHLKQGVTFSGVMTFFFSPLYLQYKINRLDD